MRRTGVGRTGKGNQVISFQTVGGRVLGRWFSRRRFVIHSFFFIFPRINPCCQIFSSDLVVTLTEAGGTADPGDDYVEPTWEVTLTVGAVDTDTACVTVRCVCVCVCVCVCGVVFWRGGREDAWDRHGCHLTEQAPGNEICI